jgi:hypothetical protein
MDPRILIRNRRKYLKNRNTALGFYLKRNGEKERMQAGSYSLLPFPGQIPWKMGHKRNQCCDPVLGLLDPYPDPVVRGTDPDPDSKNSKKNLNFYYL